MGKYKNSLPEGVDITDPREPDLPSDKRGEPREIDWAMVDLDHCLKTFEDDPVGLTPFAQDLAKAAARLQDIAETAAKPF